jgi:hypothetical protein
VLFDLDIRHPVYSYVISQRFTIEEQAALCIQAATR